MPRKNQDINVESFSNLKDPLIDYSGFARLTEVEFNGAAIQDDISQHFSTTDSFFVFSAYLLPEDIDRDNNIVVVIPDDPEFKEHTLFFDWIGSKYTSEAAGKDIPVTHLSETYYTISTFDNLTGYESADRIQQAIDNELVRFNGKRWCKNYK